MPEKIAIIGLGYVGLPLAVAFAEKFPVVGFDIDRERIEQLRSGKDSTREVASEALQAAANLTLSAAVEDIAGCDIYIITVPTPVDHGNQPDFSPLIGASETVGSLLAQGNIVIYESTVYPGATEDVCVPVLARASGLTYNRDFFVGYSPERINPGDKQRGLRDIIKVTSGSTPETAEQVDHLYRQIVVAGTHKAPSLAVAEACKVIENVQRDVNIALVNELATLFEKLHIDTLDVLEAAGTKWNFLPFRPGLVGGHCIGVDPHYLIRKALTVGHYPELIQASRRINNQMAAYLADRVVRLMLQRQVNVNAARVLVLGLAFKENCPDLRNTRVVDVVREFAELGMQVDVYDPWVDRELARREYQLQLVEEPAAGTYDTILLAVAHDDFKQLGAEQIRHWGKTPHVLFDTKCVFHKDEVDGRL